MAATRRLCNAPLWLRCGCREQCGCVATPDGGGERLSAFGGNSERGMPLGSGPGGLAAAVRSGVTPQRLRSIAFYGAATLAYLWRTVGSLPPGPPYS
eukprot:7363706-Prymnesium_polylepis.1